MVIAEVPDHTFHGLIAEFEFHNQYERAAGVRELARTVGVTISEQVVQQVKRDAAKMQRHHAAFSVN